jgi:hypothetical protein
MYPDVWGSPTGWSTQTGTGSGVRESQLGCFLYRCASLQQGTRRSRDHQNRDSVQLCHECTDVWQQQESQVIDNVHVKESGKYASGLRMGVIKAILYCCRE